MACVGGVPNPISASLPTRGVALFFIARISRHIRNECDARSAALPGALHLASLGGLGSLFARRGYAIHMDGK